MQTFSPSLTLEERNQLIEQHLPLVRFAVSKMRAANGLDYEDLVGHGVLGLIQAVDRFDASQGVQFGGFALSRIRGAVLDAMRELDPVGRTTRVTAKRIDATFNALSLELGREPTATEVQQVAGIAPTRYWDAHAASNRAMISFDQVIGEDLNLADRVADDSEPVTARLERQELRAALGEAITSLPERDRVVLSLYYVEGLPMRDVATILNISETRVSQLLNRTYARLRANTQLAAAA